MRRYGLVDIPDQASDIDAVPITRTLTINGTTYDLSANRSWTISSTGFAIGSSITGGTPGSVLYIGAGSVAAQSNADFFYDYTNNNLKLTGKILLGTATDAGFRLDVQGLNSRFGGTTNYTILYSEANGGGAGFIKSGILMTNLIQNELRISAGVNTGDVIRIYLTDLLSPGTVRPLCINGNGRETVFGSDTTTNTASSLVTMVSTTKGFLPPRMTSAQRTAIGTPATGLVVYQTDGSAGLYVRNAAAWQLLGVGSGGTGTVTSVSVTSANGFAGTVLNETTTPAITISTNINGVLKGNGTAISAAVSGTDYQAPITLTTTGTSGASTKVGNTINVPQYQGQLTLTTTGTTGPSTLVGNTLNVPNYGNSVPSSSGFYTPTVSGISNCTAFVIPQMQYFTVGDMVHVAGRITFQPTSSTNPFGFFLTIPVSSTLSDYYCGGTCVRYLPSVGASVSAGSIQGGGVDQVYFYFATQSSTVLADWYFTFTYSVGGL